MDEQGGAGGVPPHDGHDTGRTERHTTRRGARRTAAADTDEASRLDRPDPAPGPAKGEERWVDPQDEEEAKRDS